MRILDLIKALVELGIPMAVLSWFIFSWLYGAGEIDREAGRKAISARVKKLKKSFEKKEEKNTNYVYDKWMWFGSGFYGLAGLWTFAVVEISDLFGFVFNFPGLTAMFEDGFISFVVALLLNQVTNIVTAFVWFGYWSADSVIVWVLVAYIGYWAGVEMARRGMVLPIDQWLEKLSIKKS
jgi:hypothetical protein